MGGNFGVNETLEYVFHCFHVDFDPKMVNKIERGQMLLELQFHEVELDSECESSIKVTVEEFLLLKKFDLHVMFSRNYILVTLFALTDGKQLHCQVV